MKSFIRKISLILGIAFLLNAASPVLGLYKLRKFYNNPEKGVLKFINPQQNKSKEILVIGCSNLQHNINYQAVQEGLNKDVDFMYFSGSQNSSFLEFMFDEGIPSDYETIILYAPYHLLKKEKFINKSNYHFKEVACFRYTLSNLKHNPFNLFYDWEAYYDSIRTNRFEPINLENDFTAGNDPYIDSLNQVGSIYNACSLPFNHQRHIIEFPKYNATDARFIRYLSLVKNNIYILFSPIPNIEENMNNLTNSDLLKAGFQHLLNQPYQMDSSYFYDQWYHLNKCGKEIETKNMISVLKSNFE